MLRLSQIFNINRAALGMVACLLGVTVHSFFPLITIPTQIWWLMAVVLLVIGVLMFRSRLFVSCFLYLGVCLLGLLRFDVAVPPSIQIGETKTYAANVQNVTDSLYGTQAAVKIEDEGFRALLTLKTEIPIGSTIRFSCALKPVIQKPDELDRRFAYRLHQAQAQCTPKELMILAPPAWWDVRQTFADLRVWTNRRIMSVLPGEEGALIAGMLYGERGMSQKSNDLFRRAGLTHLIAVSGSNITIVASIVFAVLLGFGLWRRQAFWMTTIILASYVTFTGFSASVARAAVMGWLVLLARHVGRQPRTWHVLLVSAFTLCLIDPWMLAFDAGFALSFLATIGLMSWSPILNHRLKFLPEIGGLREAAATTISATLMTTPYMAFAFERVSLAGLLTNLVAVPLVSWAMLFGALSATWGQLIGWQVIAMPSVGVAKIIFLSASLADYFPWLSIQMQSMNFMFLVATYALLLWIWFKLRIKNKFSTKD
ncbi:MAG: ComEC/Rec2 family competence protein [Patescibacteria group bacterium]|nr:ComEC/Rec2 family competence protein [Patescibacteria group bacterium]